MYLKRVDIVGFKSFADKTVLNFERGMTAIVGPNGCGKSNISDAIRWVLGEQSAKALRGGSMKDVIFSGTDSQKALNMAEVSLTLADCETALKTEYNEVTVTRRVFASGDGQYLINKVPCRLKDIQRLFMDTGIGRTSYSVMEQGKIDQILSSRPEDRRAVFEEASGITKFKADRKECLRKLDQTEANLLRLEDVIREVKRQIISLQRQAGKAKRYKEQMEVLRGYDMFTTRFRLEEIDTSIASLDTTVNQLTVEVESQRHRVEQRETSVGEIRLALNATDEEISKAMDEAVAARNAVDGARQAVQANKDRIAELEAYSSRDSRDAQEAASRLEQHRATLESNTAQLAEAETRKAEAEQRWAAHRAAFEAADAQTRELRASISRLRDKTFQLETQVGKTQNALTEYETREQATLVKKERLLSEKVQLEGAAEGRKVRLDDATAQHTSMQEQVDASRRLISEMQTLRGSKNSDVSEQRRKLGALDQKTAAARERIRLLSSPRKGDSGFPEGARLLLTPTEDGLDRSSVLGALADVLQIDPTWQKAFESVLRSWLDAVVVRDPAEARRMLQWISQHRSGAARVLSATRSGSPHPVAEQSLFHVIRCPDEARDLAQHLFGRVIGVMQPAEIPEHIPTDMVYVTPEGLIVRGDGSGEAWDPEDQADNPVARRTMRDQAEKELKSLESERAILAAHIEELAGEGRALEERIQAAQQELQRVQSQVSQREGELRMIRREATEAEQRLRTVTNELQQLTLQEERGGNQREELRTRLQTAREELTTARAEYTSLTQQSEKAEAERVALGDRATEQRIAFSELAQQATQLQRQCDAARDRIRELQQLIEQREKGISDYRQRLESLTQLITEKTTEIPPLEETLVTCQENLQEARNRRSELMKSVEVADRELRELRQKTDAIHDQKNRLEIECAEKKIRRQNMIDRLTSEYRIELHELADQPPPVWETPDDPPSIEGVERMAAELRARIEAMGPVNLVAIEEHQELEDRFQFLMEQQKDLVSSKEVLLDLIRKINTTTTELFTDTFTKVNANFEVMFQRLFGGGTAKLELVDTGDVLESGIEIIARPPGKRLQSISLLSGGERTMTAVALLFALYMVKPSPFCLLDELDAPLDDANIGRFVEMLQGFVKDSQFVVITHNQRTMEAAGTLYGVTMEKKGVSKIVSVKLKNESTPAPEEMAAT